MKKHLKVGSIFLLLMNPINKKGTKKIEKDMRINSKIED